MLSSGLHLVCGHGTHDVTHSMGPTAELEEEIKEEENYRQQYTCIGLAVSLCSFTVIFLSHKRRWHLTENENRPSGLERKLIIERRLFWCQVFASALVALVVLWLPAQGVSDTTLLGELAALVSALVILNLADEMLESHFSHTIESDAPIRDDLLGVEGKALTLPRVPEEQQEMVYSGEASPPTGSRRSGISHMFKIRPVPMCGRRRK